MNLTILDFETYYDSQFSLKKLTIPEYVHDPRFHVHGVAIRRPDGTTEFRTDVPEALRELQDEFGVNLERTCVVCHNAQFDLYILNHKYDIRPAFFIDTMLLSYHVHGRRERGTGQDASLKALAKLYGLEAKGDLAFMCGARHPNAAQLAELAAYAIRDVVITTQLAEHLLPKISRPEVELPVLMHTVRLFTEKSVRVDIESLDDLAREIHEATNEHIQLAGVAADSVSKNGEFTELLGEVLAQSGRSVPMKQGKRKLIPATAKTDPEMQRLLEDDDPRVAALAVARLGKKGQDQKLARIDTMRRIANSTGGKLPPQLVYYGGHTGRFTGGGGFNIQNIGRTGLGLKIRGELKPAPGNVFVSADLAQVEARCNALLAGELPMLEDFRNGVDLYSVFASQTFGCEVRKPRDDDPPDLQSSLKRLRQVGKQAVLGLGFGMGALKFMNTLRSDVDTAPLFETGELNPARCHEIVRTFRERYPRIPQFWNQLENSVRMAINGGSSSLDRLSFDRDEDTLLITLPSGRKLRYPNMRCDWTPQTISYMAEDGTEAEFTPEGPSIVYGGGASLYGGKLCENVAQATARDLLVEAILRLEAANLPVVFHVHDEVIVEVPEARGPSAVDEVRGMMTTPPEWAPDLPISCEVQLAHCYGK